VRVRCEFENVLKINANKNKQNVKIVRKNMYKTKIQHKKKKIQNWATTKANLRVQNPHRPQILTPRQGTNPAPAF